MNPAPTYVAMYQAMRQVGASYISVPGAERQAKDREKKYRIPFLKKSIRAENILLLATLLAVIMGTVIGLHLNPILRPNKQYLTSRQRVYLKFPGEMFMRGLRMLIVPMVISSNISSIASMNAKAARLLTGLSVVYYVMTTAMAVILGLVLVSIIQPGSIRPQEENNLITPHVSSSNKSVRVMDSILDLFRNMIPKNLVLATFEKTAMKFETKQLSAMSETYTNITNLTVESKDVKDAIEEAASGTNLLGLITFSILFGFAVHSLGPEAAVLADLFHAVRRVCVYLVSVMIWFSPIGIMSLIAEEIARTQNLGRSLEHLSLYVATVLSTLFIHGVFVLPLLLYLFTRRNPLQFAYNMLQALMCALGTASSTATLPCTIRCLEGRNQIDPRVTRFMLPLGTSINMDGTALYQAIAVVYISQVTRVNLSLDEIILVGLTAALASMAAASMPSAGMITMVMVLTAVGLPDNRISLLWPVDWFLDRFRTMVNVFSDSVGVAVVSKLCEAKLSEVPLDPDTLPPIEDGVLDLPGGLSEVEIELKDMESGSRHSRQRSHNNNNFDLNNGQLRQMDHCNENHTNSACVYVVDDETIVLKF